MLCRTLALFGLFGFSVLHAEEPQRLQESLQTGQQFQIHIRTELTGKMQVPAEQSPDKKPGELKMTGSSRAEYVEKILALQPPADRVARVYRTLEFKRQVAGESSENALRPAVRRVVVARSERGKTGFSPDGPLTFAEIEMLRGESFTPALLGLLPTQPVAPGQGWKATPDAVRELTDLEQITAGGIDCMFQEIAERGGQRNAVVRFKGNIAGAGANGPNRQQLEGYYFFDLNTRTLSHLFFNGTSTLLDAEGKTRGQIEGRYILSRKPIDTPDLSAAALGGVALEPNAENTRLLFADPTLGVEVTHPRHWTMRQADARQIILDEPRGNGLLISLEPAARAPTVEQYRGEVEAWLKKEHIAVHRREEPRRIQAGIDSVDRFRYEAEIKGQRCILDYYVLRQAAAGATCAGRWEIAAAPTLQAEAERIIRSLRLTRPRKP